ncbi:dolichyl-P-Man:Man(7)GlcNAc(2)-PP-dolichol alpha-1,6-mannosyltransferase, variant 2 [Puccinia graminis f. sp. tritici]|uniref:Mannosyltransferase n=3 Tax=Puccinia graminis f. sp. tritici TaxID=56615 RepID=E3K063_PUCGT|nr:uncharacterized protein PGTG_03644 [Puccinia graminis f. sp. tritici CRL 75-36-700-3]EFP77688.2 hypothetical protein PGTG_03644 [Puccinia graminis f. sp. tritici CRL 75-36-700-3]KAA1110299.1 dolichyl-P-Man:Man(7)GlcNAc(2)-PP-dolichol alpha-1,6-mannosyltransferase, variant 2 [Puccinia graminis f. sp. tritici]KAA1128620.1 dolichyl-P-Man:Man(7)GlcNAc(2)-PP-dolichol alpha-1,6-mannosyltransferase [Puccinia graminis f. sp. tritici]
MLVISAALIVFISTFVQLFLSPFTKVEESFNLHAIHDFIHQPNLSAVAHAGDHLQFPGPLPRTFIGALLIGGVSRALLPILRFIGLVHSKFAEQIFVRALLAILNSSSLVYFGLCARFVFGDLVSISMLLLSASQFHLAFYASRTLPNMFAFPFVQIALGQYMITMKRGKTNSARKQGTLNACSFLTIAAVIFRLELVALLAPIVLLSLISKRVTFWQLVSRGFLVTFAGLEMTLPIDSYFWQKLTWPEGASLIFNVLEGKSAEWGVMPWHFYLTSSLPKLLGITYPLALLGFVLNRKVFLLGACTLVFVVAMSCLGHKETRFIIYIVPVWNLSTSICVHRITSPFRHSRWIKLGLMSLIGVVAALNMAFTTYLSMHNYPGGAAMMALHSLEDLRPIQELNIHLDNLVSQTGGSRFLQLNDLDGAQNYPLTTKGRLWRYDKLANITESSHQFDVILSEQPELHNFQALEHVTAFDGVRRRHFKAPLSDRLFDFVQSCWAKKACFSFHSMWDILSPIEIVFNHKQITIFLQTNPT